MAIWLEHVVIITLSVQNALVSIKKASFSID